MTAAARLGDGSAPPIPDMTGMQRDVLRALRGLSDAGRSSIFDRYESRYGRPARLFAERACSHGFGQRVTLSREVLGRLFELVPQALPSRDRMALAAQLWRRLRHESHATARIPPSASSDEIIAAVHAHFAREFEPRGFSDRLRRRFPWLGEGDIRAQEEVLNLLLEEERRRLLDIADGQIALLRHHLRRARELRYVLELDGHRLELVRDPAANCIHIAPASRRPVSTGRGTALPWGLGGFFLGAVSAAASWWLIAHL